MTQTLFRPGDRVHWTNKQGLDLGVRTIVEVDDPDKFGNRYYITPNDAHWMYVRERNLAPATPDFGSF